MSKYGTTKKPLESASLIGVCFIILVIVIAIYVFSHRGTGAHIMAPVPIQNFSSPSSVTAASIESAAVIYLPSIKETQQQIKDMGYDIEVDGMLCGACYNPGHSQTQELWDLAYNGQSALETWPEVK